MTAVYLLHFERPHRHARHYLGWSRDLDARIAAHRKGQGARLLEVIISSGNDFVVVRTWPSAARSEERRLKRQHNTPRHCPICREQSKKGATSA